MKKIIRGCLALLGVILLANCQQKEPAGSCRIHGTIDNQYNGKLIYLVPITNDSPQNVDSATVKDGHFEFVTDTTMVAKVIMHMRYRFGLQTLLVVAEPGDVNVCIDSISHASGTPQNDSLEMWKGVTEAHNLQMLQLRQAGNQSAADSVHLAYKHYTRRLAENLKSGVLHDFLKGLYPLTYQKQLPDGRTVTVNADTHEEVAE